MINIGDIGNNGVLNLYTAGAGDENDSNNYGYSDFLTEHGPIATYKVYLSSTAAKRKYKQIKSATGGSGNNGIADVVKHVFWMVQLTGAVGEDAAWDAGVANENSNESNNPFSRKMDFNNNRWGINWALRNKSVIKTTTDISALNRRFYTEIYQAILDGDIIIKEQDMHYVNKSTLQNIFDILNLN